MNIIKKIISAIKNMFRKHDDVKEIVEPKINVTENKAENFIKTLKADTVHEKENKKEKKKVETLICNGDGLGIQKKINY